ncbi:hypothetical protein [Macrococcus carouselicus]|uniref:hypothetical protein n=1 Tax=Macrococcus carouselicus TaxID=69969 RepID=UPI001408564E|nr:hypothetical protein [Macrococcus carouselicus]
MTERNDRYEYKEQPEIIYMDDVKRQDNTEDNGDSRYPEAEERLIWTPTPPPDVL